MARRPQPIATPRPAIPPATPERTYTAEEVEALVDAKLAELHASTEADLERQLLEVERQTAPLRADLDAKLDALRARLAADETATHAELEAATDDARAEEERAEAELRQAVVDAAASNVAAEREQRAAAIERRAFVRHNARTAVLVALRDAGVLEERLDEAVDAALEGFAVVEREPRGFYIERVGGPEVYTDENAADLARAFLDGPARRDFLPAPVPKSAPRAPARRTLSSAELRLQDALERGEQPTADMLLAAGAHLLSP